VLIDYKLYTGNYFRLASLQLAQVFYSTTIFVVSGWSSWRNAPILYYLVSMHYAVCGKHLFFVVVKYKDVVNTCGDF